jgi:hypothetical protein
VLTDYRVFANLLRRVETTVLLPVAAIVLLAESGRITAEDAITALERIECIVRRVVYEEAKQELRELVGKGERR